ncbi:MAG: hypothetical protein QOH92_1659 [Chloroflexota bacterium]|nr:hypothetical protein [Chloroflexota bacterium]
MIGAVAAGIGWTVVLLAQFYYIIVNDVGPSWHDFLVGQLQALLYVPHLFVQGTVIRDLAGGRIISGLAAAVALTALLLAVAMVSRLLWATFSRWRPTTPATLASTE